MIIILNCCRKESVELREAVFARVESVDGPFDQRKLPSAYTIEERKKAYSNGLKWGRAFMEEGSQTRHGMFDIVTRQYAFMNALSLGCRPMMFTLAIKLLGSTEQQECWLKLAEAGKIIGVYYQNELGHSTFFRGIETVRLLNP